GFPKTACTRCYRKSLAASKLIGLRGGTYVVCRGPNDPVVLALFHDVGRPAENARGGECRREEFLRQSQSQIDHALVELQIGAQRTFLLCGLRDEGFIDGLQGLDEPLLLRRRGDLVGEPFDYSR